MDEYKISIDCDEAFRYLGYRSPPVGDILDEMNCAAAMVFEACRPHIISRSFGFERTAEGIAVKGASLCFSGRSISALLHNSNECLLFCATIGTEIEALIRKWQIRDIAFAAMLDACASSAVEGLCNSFESELLEEYSAKGMFLTDRFSPGYGDLPITLQRDFCAALDTPRKIGVCVSESGILIPRKSVTAIIGISNYEQRHIIDGCNGCILFDNCKFRTNGVSCYGQAI
ncbi:MAG: hypothetical protein RR227_03850 [Oscillospiraceae bacterium]